MATWDPENDVELTDSEDEENFSMKRDFYGREALLFVVDAYLSANTERFINALTIIRSAFVSGMLVNDKDLLGLMFFNTKFSPPPPDAACLDNIVVPENCAVFLPIHQLTKAIVDHYLEFLMNAETTFENEYGVAESSGSFASMLRLSIELLEKCGHKLNNAKIVYMTDIESPHAPQTREFQNALQKANHLEAKEIEFQVIPMVDVFNYNLFYKEFLMLSRAIESDAFVVPDTKLQREILEDRKLKQDFLRRCLGHFVWSLGPNLKISVQYYNYFQRNVFPKKVQLLRTNNAIVTQKRAIMVRKQNEETLELMQEHQVKVSDGWHEINLGSNTIRITTEQMNRVRNLHAPGMMLLGFKHKSALKNIFYSKPSNFMYPNDQHILGSKRLFRALWERCVEREKIVICLFMCKRKSAPRYVALVPVEAAPNDNEESQSQRNYRSLVTGDGFKIVYLPAAKHVRHNDLSDWNAVGNTAAAQGVELFVKVIKKLRVNYQPNLINDPSLEALQTDLLGMVLDVTTDTNDRSDVADISKQDGRIASLMPEYKEIFGSEVPAVPPALKRSSASVSSDGAGPSKMQKVDDEAIKSLEYVMDLIQKKNLNICTVVQLRFILKEHFDVTLPKNALKSVIIEKIEEKAL